MVEKHGNWGGGIPFFQEVMSILSVFTMGCQHDTWLKNTKVIKLYLGFSEIKYLTIWWLSMCPTFSSYSILIQFWWRFPWHTSFSDWHRTGILQWGPLPLWLALLLWANRCQSIRPSSNHKINCSMWTLIFKGYIYIYTYIYRHI